MKPTRIQLSRAKGFNLQETSRKYNGLGAVKVDRSSVLWGNPFTVSKYGTVECCLEMYREFLRQAETSDEFPAEVAKLFDKNLACWCSLDQPCHVDVLLPFVAAWKKDLLAQTS